MTRVILLPCQLLGTFAILAFVSTGTLKAILLLLLWLITFWPIRKKELLLFVLINIIFVLSDLGAIRNNFFSFTNPDMGVLPYFEFFMWGFYLMHAKRMLNGPYPRPIEPAAVILALLFALIFVIAPIGNAMLILSASVLLLSLWKFHERGDILYLIYLSGIGVIVEWIGLYFNIWQYSQTYLLSFVQIIIMWGAAGLYFRRIVGPLFYEKRWG